MKKLLLLLLLLLPLHTSYSQRLNSTNAVVVSATDPTGNACSSASPNLTYGTGNTRNLYTCQGGVYAVSTGSGSIPSATATVEGKAVLGAQAPVAFASLGTCAAGNRGQRKQLTDLNKGTRTCTLTTGSTYAWVDDDPVVRVSKFGVTPSATAANNVTNIATALAVAAAGYPVVIFDEGTYVFNSEIYVPGGITIRGQGDNKTILQYTKATGSLFRATDYAVAQSYNRFENFQIQATGSAVNANTTGIDMSSMSHSVAQNITSYNFGTQILLDGHRSGSLIQTYYNDVTDCYLAMGASGSGVVSRGIAIQGEANSNTLYRPKFNYLAYPLAIGDSAAAAPNQILVIGPKIELWESSAVLLSKGWGITLLGGRYEGVGADSKIFNVADDVALVQGVLIDAPYLEPTAAVTVLATKNPTVTLRGGSGRSYITRTAGLSSDLQNIVPNAGFEGWVSTTLQAWSVVDNTNWSSGSAYAVQEATVIHDGVYSAKIGNGASLYLGARTPSITIDASKAYTLDYWARSNNTAAGHRIAIRIYDSASAEITTGWTDKIHNFDEAAEGGTSSLSYSGVSNSWLLGADLTHAAADTWYRHSYLLTFPTGAVTAQIAFVTTASATHYTFIDSVQLVQGQAASKFQPKALADSGVTQTYYGDLPVSGTAQGKVLKMLDGSQSVEVKKTGSDSMIQETGTNRLRIAAYDTDFYRYDNTTHWGRVSNTGTLDWNYDLRTIVAGKTLSIKTGSNACSGSTTLSSGTATVSTTCTGTTWGTDFIVILTPRGSSTGALRVSTHTAATSFVITSSDGASTDAVGWLILKQQ